MLVLAHREELIDQAIAKIQACNPTLRIDKEMAEHHADPNYADVVVASVASLGREGSARMAKYNWSDFDKFVVDEAHHSVASTYMNIFTAAGLLVPNDKRLLLGLTATPQRGDGQALATLFQKLVFSYPMRQAIEDGWLVDVRGVKVSTNVSLDGVKSSNGDYNQTQLAETVNTPQRNQLVLKAWLQEAKGLTSLGFTAGIQHAKDLAALFQVHGIAAEAIWGDDPEREDKLARHRAGITLVLFNSDLLIEGYDDWRIRCVLLTAPTKSPVKFAQEIGRGTRLDERLVGLNLKEWDTKLVSHVCQDQGLNGICPFCSTTDLKRQCIVIDVVDASSKNSLVTLPTLMGLPPGLNLNGKGLYEAVKLVEEAQAEYPHLDFSTLENLDDLEVFIESVNLFEVRFPPEVETGSTLSWFPSPTGGYVLNLPDFETGKHIWNGYKVAPDKLKERIVIQQNLLDKWEILGTIKGKKASGVRDTLAEAFSGADAVIAKFYPDAMTLLTREAGWHADPPTDNQLKALKRYFKGKTIPANLTKGQASKLIGQYKAGK